MANTAYEDVAQLAKQHPDWKFEEITAALSDKYSIDEINNAIAQVAGETVGQSISGAKVSTLGKFPAPSQVSSADKKKLETWSTPQQLTTDILNRAGSQDPTAGGKTLTTSPLSPLTGQPVVQNLDTTVGNFSTGGLSADFIGDQAKGIAPNLSMSPAIDKTTGKYYVQVIDPATGAGRKVYVLGDPNNPKAYQVMDYEQGAQYFIKQYTDKGAAGIKQLKKLLADNYTYKNQTIARQDNSLGTLTDNTMSAIQKYLDELTTTNFNLGPTRGFISVGGALNSDPSQPNYAGTRTSVSTTYTPNDIATMDFNSFMTQQLGRGATSQEVSEYLDVLHNYEKQHPQKSVVTTDSLGTERNRVTYSGATAEDKKMLMVGLLSKALTDKGINPDDISKSGGAIARGMQDLQAYAAAYGLGHYSNAKTMNSLVNASVLTNAKATNADTLKMIQDTLVPGGSIDTEKAKIKAQAKEIYKPLASYIDSGGSIKDIAEQYNYLNQKYLETLGPVDVFNPDIQKGLMGDGKNIMNQNDYIRMLKSKSEWGYTQNAREEAAQYANKILSSFGLA